MKKLTILFTIITLMLVANTGLLAAPKPASKPSKSTSARLISKKDVFYFKFMYNKKGKNIRSGVFAC